MGWDLFESFIVGVDVGFFRICKLSGAVDSVLQKRSALALSWKMKCSNYK
jgi:hypothetical protein